MQATCLCLINHKGEEAGKCREAQVRTNSIVYSCVDRDAEFCADAVRATDEKWINVARRLEVKDPAKSTEFGVGARTTRRTHVWLDRLDKRVSRIDGDARLCVGEAWSC
jgi:hypothetical protein